MKKIVVFSGAGLDKESGVPTFRDSKSGLWYNYKIEEVATREALLNDPQKVFEFHNMLRRKLKDVYPNDAHKALVKLEDKFDVIHITQNVSDLLERAGSKNILHLHGELMKARSTRDPLDLISWTEDLHVGDKHADGSRLRPHTVLFDEYPYNVDESYKALAEADILIIVGTSFDISYTGGLIMAFRGQEAYYVDPNPSLELGNNLSVKFIRKKAVEGVVMLVNKLLKEKI